MRMDSTSSTMTPCSIFPSQQQLNIPLFTCHLHRKDASHDQTCNVDESHTLNANEVIGDRLICASCPLLDQRISRRYLIQVEDSDNDDADNRIEDAANQPHRIPEKNDELSSQEYAEHEEEVAHRTDDLVP